MSITNTRLTEAERRLGELVPDPALAKAYVNRKVYGKLDFEVFDWAREKKKNLLVKGPTQSAKTMAFRAYGAARRLPVVTVDIGAAMDPSLILGGYRKAADGSGNEWFDGLLVCSLMVGDTVNVLDECNMAHPKVMAAYHPLGDGRRAIYLQDTGEYIRANKGVLIAATMNPDYIGTTPIGQAFSARFRHINWDYDSKVESKLLSPGIRKVAEKLRSSDHVTTPVSTHLLMELQDTITDMGYDFAVEVFRASFNPEESKGIEYAFEAGIADVIKAELGG